MTSLHYWSSCNWGKRMKSDLKDKNFRFTEKNLTDTTVSPLLCSDKNCIQGFVDIPPKEDWIQQSLCDLTSKKECDLNDFIDDYCRRHKNCKSA